MRRVLSCLLLAVVWPATPSSGQSPASADSLWRRGDFVTAGSLYAARLAADPADRVSLRRLGLIAAWNGRYRASLALFDRLLRLDPSDRQARVDRARILIWMGDTGAGVSALREIIEHDPLYPPALEVRARSILWIASRTDALDRYQWLDGVRRDDDPAHFDRARLLAGAADSLPIALPTNGPNDGPRNGNALFAIASALTWAGTPDSAAAVYRRILENRPDDAEALRGLARVAALSGDLADSEAAWARAAAADPRDPEAWVGLAQTLRWEERDAAAVQALEQALARDPADGDALALLPVIQRDMRPRVAPHYSYESDSEGNRAASLSASGAWRAWGSVGFRAGGYLRTVRNRSVAEGSRRARAGTVGAWLQREPGWTLGADFGAAGSDRTDARPLGIFQAILRSPGRYRAGASLRVERRAFDATTMLVQWQVVVDEVSVSGYSSPAAAWTVSADGSAGIYRGRVSGVRNQHFSGQLAMHRRLTLPLTIGLAVRAFSFENDLDEGYFDPDFYGVAELTTRWSVDQRAWSIGVFAAPGIQKIGTDGASSGSLRIRGDLAVRMAPGRFLQLGAGYDDTGLARLGDGARSYHLSVLAISSIWTF